MLLSTILLPKIEEPACGVDHTGRRYCNQDQCRSQALKSGWKVDTGTMGTLCSCQTIFYAVCCEVRPLFSPLRPHEKTSDLREFQKTQQLTTKFINVNLNLKYKGIQQYSY